MKKHFIALFIGLSTMTLLSGCLDLQLGGGTKSYTTKSDAHPESGQPMVAPTVGQQLIDLQKAKDSGAINEAEYQAEKAKLLGN